MMRAPFSGTFIPYYPSFERFCIEHDESNAHRELPDYLNFIPGEGKDVLVVQSDVCSAFRMAARIILAACSAAHSDAFRHDGIECAYPLTFKGTVYRDCDWT